MSTITFPGAAVMATLPAASVVRTRQACSPSATRNVLTVASCAPGPAAPAMAVQSPSRVPSAARFTST